VHLAVARERAGVEADVLVLDRYGIALDHRCRPRRAPRRRPSRSRSRSSKESWAFAVLAVREWGTAARSASRAFSVVWPRYVPNGAFPFALGARGSSAAAWDATRRSIRPDGSQWTNERSPST
jgi:hypothetical protein